MKKSEMKLQIKQRLSEHVLQENMIYLISKRQVKFNVLLVLPLQRNLDLMKLPTAS